MTPPDPKLAHLLAGDNQHLPQAGFGELEDETDHVHKTETMVPSLIDCMIEDEQQMERKEAQEPHPNTPHLLAGGCWLPQASVQGDVHQKETKHRFTEGRQSNRRKKGSPPAPRSWPTCWLGIIG